MTAALTLPLAGGIGLFLLGIWLMTEGLRFAAGAALERILARATGSRLRGFASGIAVTALLQSSSAVTVATIGFINAGLLSLQQSLWLLFGANVGTTMTGWLVTLVGFEFRIDAAALPLVGAGMLMQLTGQGTRRGAFGLALAGFGVLFLGIDVLKDAFSGLGASISLPEPTDGVPGLLAHAAAGIALSVLMQSSSAALALALTAAHSGVLSLEAAAAVVVGTNVGTTVTALIAALGATPNARRAAAAHVIFNLGTGVVAFLILPLLIRLLVAAQVAWGTPVQPAATLAMFHTIFNVLGVLLMWPFAGRLAVFLSTRFRTHAEDRARPAHLDASAAAVPELALDAIQRELQRTGTIAIALARRACGTDSAAPDLARERDIVLSLSRQITGFAAKLSQTSMAHDSGRRIPQLLRLARYYEAVAELATDWAALPVDGDVRRLPEVAAAWAALDAALAATDPVASAPTSALEAEEPDPMLQAYERAKLTLLQAGGRGELEVSRMDALLDQLSLARRAAIQARKASRLAASLARG